MTAHVFTTAWPLLKQQVKTLHLPWLDEVASSDRDPFKILISCILSLRTQDRTTAGASQRLFAIAPTAGRLAALPVDRIIKAIYPVGFYRVKAARIKQMSRVILDEYGGIVPDTIEELLKLNGVGRKTANLVVTLGYGKPGICVDTHVHRITNRWALTRTTTPDQTEFALRNLLPARYWQEINSNLVAFGQGICKPLSPLCSRCQVARWCAKEGVSRSR